MCRDGVRLTSPIEKEGILIRLFLGEKEKTVLLARFFLLDRS